MIGDFATTIATVLIMAIASPSAIIKPNTVTDKVIGEKQFSLEDRYAVKSVNEIMKKNILLNLAYLNGTVTKKSDIDWIKVTSPFHFEKTLGANETFAFHEIVRSEYKDNLAFTTKAHFNASDGFLSDGYLYGDGVCHLASLINWAALDAGLNTVVPKDHRSVAHIPEIPDDYGVSIYMNRESGAGANNNLYITNTKDHAVIFHFDFDGQQLKVYVTEKA